MANPSSGGDDADRAGSTGSVSRRRLLAGVTTAAVGGSALTGCSLASPVDRGTDVPEEYDGVAVTRDEAWVETPVDTDDDGTPDRILVRVARPDSTEEGEQVPVIGTASPYYGEQTHSDATEEMYYDRGIAPSATADDGGEGSDESAAAAVGAATEGGPTSPSHRPPAGNRSTPGHLERRYVPRGYAVAHISSLGTHRSTGCYTAAGPPTVAALEAVVDWLNGRATAYDAQEGGDPVEADWTNGKAGLIGASALGELANGVASTGVDGLETVVPQAANVGQYGLFRSNGTPVSVVPDGSPGITDIGTWIQASNARRDDCGHWTDIAEEGQDLATGDYNDFWHERTFLTDADAVDAAVLLTHAVDDRIVKPNNFADWYETLLAHDVPVHLWLHEGGHTSPGGEAWVNFLDRWFAHWLKGEDNGITDEDPVTVIHGGPTVEGGSAETYESWPVPGTEAATVRFESGGTTVGGLGVTDPEATTESLVDDPSVPASDLAASAESDHRLRYETPPLSESVHVSGRVVPSLSLSFDEPTVVSAALVEYGDGGAEIVTRGWADPLNRPSYSEYDTPLAYRESLRESSPLDGDERVQVEFPLQATDHVFDSGSRIGVVVYASDREFTLHPPGNREVRLSLPDSSVALPVAGGESALTGAFGDAEGDAGTATDDGEATETDGPTQTDTSGDGQGGTETGSTAPADSPTPTDSPTSMDGSTESASQPAQTAEAAADETETEAGTSGDGPGFGIGSALASLGGVGYALKRRFTDE